MLSAVLCSLREINQNFRTHSFIATRNYTKHVSSEPNGKQGKEEKEGELREWVAGGGYFCMFLVNSSHRSEKALTPESLSPSKSMLGVNPLT